MATPWNSLPKVIAIAPSVNTFKSRLDSHLRRIQGKTHIYTQSAAIDEPDERI